MAKRKKTGTHYVSKGERPNVNKKIRNAVRDQLMSDEAATALRKITAFRAGKKVMVTIPNPNPNETNKRFIRVPASDVWR